MSARTLRTPAKALDLFIEALREGATVNEACVAAGIGRATAYDLRKRDDEFAVRWADALEDGTEVLEVEARRRAMAGSDTLLMFLLKARRPEVYRERWSIEHSGQTVRLSPDELSAVRAAGMTPEVQEAARIIASVPLLPAEAEVTGA